MGVELYPLHWLQAGTLALGLGPLAVGITRYAEVLGPLVVALLFLLVPRRYERLRRAAVYGLLAALIAWVASALLGSSFVRPRPPIAAPSLVRALLPLPPGSSFPSRLAAVLFALAGGLAFSGEDAGLLAALFALGASLAQMATGLAYPSDVLGGLILGLSIAAGVLVGREACEAPLRRVLHWGGWVSSVSGRRRVR